LATFTKRAVFAVFTADPLPLSPATAPGALCTCCDMSSSSYSVTQCRRYFAAYEVVKKLLTPAGALPSDLHLGSVIVAGGMAGVAMWSIAIPPDVLKSRLQSAPTGTYSGIMDCARKTIAADGVGALWKGFGPAMARVSVQLSLRASRLNFGQAFPANAATFVCATFSMFHTILLTIELVGCRVVQEVFEWHVLDILPTALPPPYDMRAQMGMTPMLPVFSTISGSPSLGSVLDGLLLSQDAQAVSYNRSRFDNVLKRPYISMGVDFIRYSTR
jgi:hypothetical protein